MNGKEGFMEVEDIIKEIIDKEDEELKQQQDSKNREEIRKNRIIGATRFLQYGLAVGLVILLLMMILPWFHLGGNATYKGFVRIPSNMLYDEYKELDSQGRKNYMGIYIETSPIQLIDYVTKHFEDHSKIINQKGDEKISIFAWTHAILIDGFILIGFLIITSIVLLFIPKQLKWIKTVKYMSIISLIIIIMNYLALKIAALNMFVLNALNELRIQNGYEITQLTQKGIAVNKDFYPYYMRVTPAFYLTLALVLLWIVISVLLERLKQNKEKENV